jgi:hypothetical protein
MEKVVYLISSPFGPPPILPQPTVSCAKTLKESFHNALWTCSACAQKGTHIRVFVTCSIPKEHDSDHSTEVCGLLFPPVKIDILNQCPR